MKRLIVFLGNILIAVTAALFAVLSAALVAACVEDDIFWLTGSGLFVFVATLLMANFFFRKATSSDLNRKSSNNLRAPPE
jgi:hypothetical protein